jgi:predicted AAA+ superfamily ATPase
VKGQWDSDRAENLSMHVILLGSSPWLMQKGLTESLTGRFEKIRITHWSYTEMREAFNLSLEEYIYFGGYPGGISRMQDEMRWQEYIKDSFAETIHKDILQMNRIDKPALLRNMFELGCQYSGQIVSYTEFLGQLWDAGNTTTLAHYLTLLSQAGLLTGLPKYGSEIKQRASSPKLNVLNTALMSALSDYTFEEAKADKSYWGRLVESTVGAHLFNTATFNCKVQYWRESPHEVDFILTNGRSQLAIEVKSGSTFKKNVGLNLFAEKYKGTRTLLISEKGVSFEKFLSHTANEWLKGIEV